jgi:putative tricarboxylic transport membrane protein
LGSQLCNPGTAALLVLALTVNAAHGQQGAWRPERPLELVVAVSAGGATDRTARFIQSIMQKHRIVDSPVLIVNKPGGGGNIALNYLDQHPGDGHYVLNSTLTLLTNHILGLAKASYTDYTMVAHLFSEPNTIVVPANSPLRNVRDIMEKLRRDPQSLSIAIGFAPGGINHLAAAQLFKQGGVDVKKLKTVVFQGQGAVYTALLGGHVDIAPMQVATALNGAQQGKLRILGIATERRGEGALAAIPTWKEQGYDLVWSNVRFMLGPKGMTPAQLAFWDAALERVVQTEEWKSDGRNNYLQLDYLGSRQTTARIAAIYKQFREAMLDVGLLKE